MKALCDDSAVSSSGSYPRNFFGKEVCSRGLYPPPSLVAISSKVSGFRPRKNCHQNDHKQHKIEIEKEMSNEIKEIRFLLPLRLKVYLFGSRVLKSFKDAL